MPDTHRGRPIGRTSCGNERCRHRYAGRCFRRTRPLEISTQVTHTGRLADQRLGSAALSSTRVGRRPSKPQAVADHVYALERIGDAGLPWLLGRQRSSAVPDQKTGSGRKFRVRTPAPVQARRTGEPWPANVRSCRESCLDADARLQDTRARRCRTLRAWRRTRRRRRWHATGCADPRRRHRGTEPPGHSRPCAPYRQPAGRRQPARDLRGCAGPARRPGQAGCRGRPGGSRR